MSYRCTICERVFEDCEMESALEISGGRGRARVPITYLIDGNYHALRKVPVRKQQPQAPAPEPKEDTDLLQATLSVLAELPTPPTSPIPGEEIKTELPQVTLEEEDEPSLTVMGSAWRRRK